MTLEITITQKTPFYTEYTLRGFSLQEVKQHMFMLSSRACGFTRIQVVAHGENEYCIQVSGPTPAVPQFYVDPSYDQGFVPSPAPIPIQTPPRPCTPPQEEYKNEFPPLRSNPVEEKLAPKPVVPKAKVKARRDLWFNAICITC